MAPSFATANGLEALATPSGQQSGWRQLGESRSREAPHRRGSAFRGAGRSNSPGSAEVSLRVAGQLYTHRPWMVGLTQRLDLYGRHQAPPCHRAHPSLTHYPGDQAVVSRVHEHLRPIRAAIGNCTERQGLPQNGIGLSRILINFRKVFWEMGARSSMSIETTDRLTGSKMCINPDYLWTGRGPWIYHGGCHQFRRQTC